VQDIAPTSQAVFWLVISNAGSAAPTVTPVRYDLASEQVTTGTSLAGVVGSPALTVTGGWVWVVVGRGAGVSLEQLDPTTLAVHSQRLLSAQDAAVRSGPPPVLTATVSGPLWVAAGKDLWELKPTSGTLETEFKLGYSVTSMSTDPTGTLLYTGGTRLPGRYGMVVGEYDAHTGHSMVQSDQRDAVAGGSVAATNGGVWVSYRTGMAGPALELSSSHLSTIAPPADPNGPFDTFHQIMGVSSGVSDGVLWLTSINALACADPGTSTVRASEPTEVLGPIASGGRLYASPPSGGVQVITPPTVCFGLSER
jgi:hypothetical protein